MDNENEEITGVKFSEFSSAIPNNNDDVVGLHSGDNARFSIANIILTIRQGLASIFVPQTRTVNNKALSSNINLTAADVGAGTYSKPSGGIPATDLASGVIPTVPSISTSNPNMDGTAAAGSTGEVSDAGHTHPTDTSRVPVYGMGENLLRNGYFINPVNQRGATSGSTGNQTYFINCWKTSYSGSAGSWALSSNGLTLTPGSSSATVQCIQPFDDGPFNGKQLTASVLYSDGSLSWGTITRVAGTNQYFDSDNILRMMSTPDFRFYTRTTKTAVAAKLELGTEQSLAHQENGVWVLNEIPDYEYELFRCMTSTADSTDTYANKTLATEQQIAQIQVGNTANRNYSVDSYFCWNGLLHRATSAITAGTTLNSAPGGNCTKTTVMEEIVRLTT